MTFPIFAQSGLRLWSSLGFQFQNLRLGGGGGVTFAHSRAIAVFTPSLPSGPAVPPMGPGSSCLGCSPKRRLRKFSSYRSKIMTLGQDASLYPSEGNWWVPLYDSGHFSP